MALHSLKGMAATLGAQTLAQQAGAGESMLKEGQTPSAAWLEELARALGQCCTDLLSLAQQVGQFAAQAKASNTP